MSESLRDIGVVVSDDAFPELDLALRRGRHVDRDDAEWYGFLVEYQAELEQFYRRFGFELTQRSDGFFYLLPVSERLGRRHLNPGEMLVGQALTLLYLDPVSLETGRVVGRDKVLGQLAGAMGSDALIRAFNPKRRRQDPRVAEQTVRVKVAEALRRLAQLGFVDLLEEEQLRLRPALLRFAEPVRGLAAPGERLEELAAAGELVLSPALTNVPDEPEREEGDDLQASEDSAALEDADFPEADQGLEALPLDAEPAIEERTEDEP